MEALRRRNGEQGLVILAVTAGRGNGRDGKFLGRILGGRDWGGEATLRLMAELLRTPASVADLKRALVNIDNTNIHDSSYLVM
jgi:hypothetical protein